ncbi:MAG: DUF4157 domain-containing protein, partial [Nostoc sp. ChiSLP01]
QRESAPEEEEEEEEELQMSSMVQRQGEAGMAASPNLEASINQAKGKGQPMADDIRFRMEQAFGADFSRVKVHTDSQSDELNQSIQARAFTTGEDVFFRQGEYNPGSRGGQELLAHELTHVVQQNAGAVLQTQPIKQPPASNAGDLLPKSILNSTTSLMQPAIQRLDAETGRRQYTFSNRATAHGYTQDQLRTICERRLNEIQVGERQSILLGQGFEEGNPLYGQLMYNCVFENETYYIHIFHAHGAESKPQKMG